jgi:hypothetical protein
MKATFALLIGSFAIRHPEIQFQKHAPILEVLKTAFVASDLLRPFSPVME